MWGKSYFLHIKYASEDKLGEILETALFSVIRKIVRPTGICQELFVGFEHYKLVI